jgi:hypothetical protein
MKRGTILSAGLLALALMTSACSQSSNPTSSTASTVGTSSVGGEVAGDPGVLAKLQDPQVSVQATVPGQAPRLLFTAGASGSPTSESMIAARTIESVDFEIRAADNSIIDRETTQNILTTGVLGPDQTASLTVFADRSWDRYVAVADRGAYIIGIVHGRNGEVLVTRADLPARES